VDWTGLGQLRDSKSQKIAKKMKATAPTAEQPPHVSNHTFPNDGVTLEFLQSIADSPKMKQPMYELAGMTKSEVDATDLDSLRKICQKYHVLGTAGMPDT